MNGWKLNPDEEIVQKITNAINKRDGHCPCILITNETTFCPCNDFISGKGCLCNLFIKKD